MASTTAIPEATLRQRNVPASTKKVKNGISSDVDIDKVPNAVAPAKSGSELEYKLALGLITGLAFLTRFWGISHPDEVVFDEVHFGKVRNLEDQANHVSIGHG